MSSTLFYPLRVVDITSQTKNCVAISFEVPKDMAEKFKYRAGQYLTFKADISGEEIRRSYSLCSIPSDNHMTVAVKKLKGGKFSTFANENLKTGDILDVMTPKGNFILDQHHDNNSFVFFAAGSGITPVISQIKDTLLNRPLSNITLIYGNRNLESIIFREELEGLKNKFIDRLSIYYIFSRQKTDCPLLYGRIGKEKCIEMSKVFFSIKDADAYLICGPNEMIFDVKEALEESGVPSDKIHFELFNTEGLKNTSLPSEALTNIEKQKESLITVQMDGSVFKFSMAYGEQNLLDAAISHGADLPFSCKGGVCSTCKAKITEGKVDMDRNYALEPYEIEAGYALLCQSHPRTTSVFVDFDQK